MRDDVFIKFLDRKGPLTVGYGLCASSRHFMEVWEEVRRRVLTKELS